MLQNFMPTLRDYVNDEIAMRSLGAAMLQSNAMMVPECAPELALLITNFQRPVITFNESADFNVAGGAQFHVPGAPKNRYEGPIQMIETDFGQVTALSELLMTMGSTNCIIYDGRPDRYTQAYELRNCSFTFEPLDIDGEGVSSIVRASATMKYNYTGINAELGSVDTLGRIIGADQGTKALFEKAKQYLDLIYAGNTIMNAIKDLY